MAECVAEPEISAVAPAASPHVLRPAPRTNVDGVEGSSIPGSVHVARYGGGDQYEAAEPIVSAVTNVAARDHPSWPTLCAALERTTLDTLQLVHGFSDAILLPGGRAPAPAELTWEPVHVVVTRPPRRREGTSAPPSFHVSLMLHGWLFGEFHASGRKAHQKFPLLCVLEAHNVACAPTSEREAPQWLPVGHGGASSFGWADQHVHKDEPIDFGDGFIFAEVFFGSDMARVAPEAADVPSALYVACADLERSAGLLACIVLLPELADGPSAADERGHELALRQACTVEELAAILRPYGDAVQAVLEPLKIRHREVR